MFSVMKSIRQRRLTAWQQSLVENYLDKEGITYRKEKKCFKLFL